MSLTTTPLNVAESYCSVADADTYHSARGHASWALLTTTVKEECLRKATDYIEQKYYGRWNGYRVEADQTLSLPRSLMINKEFENGLVYNSNGNYYYASDSIPAGVVRACAELALKANTVELLPDVGRSKTKTKVDVIEVEYSEYSSQLTSYTAIDAMLMPYLKDGSGGYNHKVIRS
jgi:hypothetical protein